MLNLNRAQILGNLTRDPEMKYTPNGQAVTNFTVATNRRWKNRDNDEWQDATEYHDVVSWGKQAETVNQILKKGQPVFVEGRIQTRNWEGQDGVKRYKTEIVSENVIALGARSGYGGDESDKSNPVEEISKTDKADKNDKDKKEEKEIVEDEIDIEDIPF